MVLAFGFGMIEILLIFMLTMVPSLVALVDILRHNFEGNQKLIWLLVILLLPWIGAILYFSIGRKQRLQGKP